MLRTVEDSEVSIISASPFVSYTPLISSILQLETLLTFWAQSVIWRSAEAVVVVRKTRVPMLFQSLNYVECTLLLDRSIPLTIAWPTLTASSATARAKTGSQIPFAEPFHSCTLGKATSSSPWPPSQALIRRSLCRPLDSFVREESHFMHVISDQPRN